MLFVDIFEWLLLPYLCVCVSRFLYREIQWVSVCVCASACVCVYVCMRLYYLSSAHSVHAALMVTAAALPIDPLRLVDGRWRAEVDSGHSKKRQQIPSAILV